MYQISSGMAKMPLSSLFASLPSWNNYSFITLLFSKHAFKSIIYHFLFFQRAGVLDLSISPLLGSLGLHQFKTGRLWWNRFPWGQALLRRTEIHEYISKYCFSQPSVFQKWKFLECSQWEPDGVPGSKLMADWGHLDILILKLVHTKPPAIYQL